MRDPAAAKNRRNRRLRPLLDFRAPHRSRRFHKVTAMRRLPRLSASLSAFLFAVAGGGCTDGAQPPEPQQEQRATAEAPADLVFTNGSIYTVDANRSWADAVAIRHGKIVRVGSDADVEALRGPDTRVIDLAGRMMLPGFQDVHIHPISGGIEAQACDLNGLTTLEQYLEAIETYARENPDEEWILGGGWSMAVFGPG